MKPSKHFLRSEIATTTVVADMICPSVFQRDTVFSKGFKNDDKLVLLAITNLVVVVFQKFAYLLGLSREYSLHFSADQWSEVKMMVKARLPRANDLVALYNRVSTHHSQSDSILHFRVLQILSFYQKHFVEVNFPICR